MKDGSCNHEIYYHDIGDYLSENDKLNIIQDKKSITNIKWEKIMPDKNNDWINQRDDNYLKYTELSDSTNSIFPMRTTGYATARDAWVTSFSKGDARSNSEKLVKLFNQQVREVHNEANLERDLTKINWSDDLLKRWSKHEEIDFNESDLRLIQYRPFTKKWVNNLNPIIGRPRAWNKLFGDTRRENNLFLNLGSGDKFSALLSNVIADYQLLFNSKSVPLYTFDNNILFEEKQLNISQNWIGKFDNAEDVFYYVYAVLHSPTYLKKYSNDLKKTLPRIPLLKDKEKYVGIGRKLADLHLNYENQPSWDGVEVQITGEQPKYRVKKMKHPKKGVLDTIIFNEYITIKNIPEVAYEYVVNGRPAIEWIIDQYQVKTDKKSGITDNPNEFSDDPKYILNLLLSVITVSMKTIELVGQLPKFEVVDDSQTHRDEFYPLGKDDDLPMVAEKSDEN